MVQLRLILILQILTTSTTVYGFTTPYSNSVFTNSRTHHNRLEMGLINDLKLIFSEEGKANRRAYEERVRDEQEAAQQEIFERRRNPQKMAEYEAMIQKRRSDLQGERDLWKFQTETETTIEYNDTGDDGNDNETIETSDPLVAWKKLREEGKIKVGSDLERDPSSSRLGSEGLVDVRTDELLPYIDQGYVDEDADVMGNIRNLFGGNKKKE